MSSASLQHVQPKNDRGLGVEQEGALASGGLTNIKKRKSSTPKHNGDSNNSNSESQTSPQEDNGGKKTKKRRKVNHACVYCRRSHMTCDQARPCSRCIKRDIGHLCHDEPREGKKNGNREEGEMGDEEEEEAISPKQQPRNLSMSGSFPDTSRVDPSLGAAGEDLVHSGAAHASLAAANGKMDPTQGFDGNSHQLYSDWTAQNPYQFQDIHNFPYNNMFNTSEVTNEYALLNDFLSNTLLDDGLYSNEDSQSMFTDPSFSNTLGPMATSRSFLNSQTNQLAPPSQAADGNALERPTSTAQIDDKTQEKYYMTAADPAGTEPPDERMNKLLKAKYDAGLLKPFNYVKGYARLNQYMEKHLHPFSRQKILWQLENFRPKFREHMQSLTDVELVRVEMWFEMKLMEYDRVFASMAIPACCWRRTGEIFRGNREMAELIGVSVERLREGKLAIHDIIGEAGLVMYWEKFGQIAFDDSKKAMLASCTLKKPDGEVPGNDMPCCFSFTIQRDEHKIPSIIIGNFLAVSSGD